MSKSLKKVWNVVSSILVALVVILALLLVGARVAGLQVFTVLSGSMEPTYHTGSLIYVKKVDPYAIQEGQPITFMLDENTVATHRVVGIVPDEEDPTVIRFHFYRHNSHYVGSKQHIYTKFALILDIFIALAARKFKFQCRKSSQKSEKI